MSGKTARREREQLGSYKFPVVKQSDLDVSQDKAYVGASHPINHQRRIRQMARSEQLTISDALKRHMKKVKLAPKPKL